MKNSIFIAILLYAFLSEGSANRSEDDHHQRRRKFREDIKYCSEKFDIPIGRDPHRIVVPEDKICYYHCLSERIGLMDEDGEVTFEDFKAEHPNMPEELLEAHSDCIEESEGVDGKCEKAKAIHMCLRKKFEKPMEKFRHDRKACLEEFDLPTSKMWALIPEEKICFYKCMSEKMGTMNEDGDFTIDEFKENNPRAPRRMVKDLEECAGTSEMEDACDRAKALWDCMNEKRKW